MGGSLGFIEIIVHLVPDKLFTVLRIKMCCISGSYNSMIRSVDERRDERDVGIPPLMTPQPGPSHSETSIAANQTCAAHLIGGRADVIMSACDVVTDEVEGEGDET